MVDHVGLNLYNKYIIRNIDMTGKLKPSPIGQVIQWLPPWLIANLVVIDKLVMGMNGWLIIHYSMFMIYFRGGVKMGIGMMVLFELW